MSFDQLTLATRKKETIQIKTSDGVLNFYANELSYTQRVALSASAQNGDAFTNWIAMSITDQNGQRMSIEQANNLPDEVAEKMLEAVLRVNNKGETETKKKSKPKRK